MLIGLLPFYLPVFLWRHGYGFAEITAFIGVSGVAFVGSLALWRRLAATRSLAQVLVAGLIAELLLVAAVVAWGATPAALVPLGLLNGLYNGCFWTTQRVLFLRLLGANDSGRRFGNFQIFVTVFLKLGILAGGWLLEGDGLLALLVASAVLTAAGSVACLTSSTLRTLRLPVGRSGSTARPVLDRRTRAVFLLDGPFLFLESHFWTLSLFLLTGEDFSRLGGVVVVLAIVFTLLFLLVKNRIDALPVARVYRLSVIAYVAAWALRAVLDEATSIDRLTIALVVITFCTTLFRLTFNKRFFDCARSDDGIEYLMEKSRLSQLSIAVVFLMLAVAAGIMSVAGSGSAAIEPWLRVSYGVAAVLAIGYLAYRPPAIRGGSI